MWQVGKLSYLYISWNKPLMINKKFGKCQHYWNLFWTAYFLLTFYCSSACLFSPKQDDIFMNIDADAKLAPLQLLQWSTQRIFNNALRLVCLPKFRYLRNAISHAFNVQIFLLFFISQDKLYLCLKHYSDVADYLWILTSEAELSLKNGKIVNQNC